MPVTIKDIAKRLKTSHVTVSKALRDQPRVSEEMRAKVKQIAQEMGYSPNYLGRGLQGGRTHTLGILWSICEPDFTEELIRSLTIKIQRHGYISYVVDSLSDPGVLAQALNDYAQRRVDAIIMEYEYPEKLLARLKAFPAVVLVGRYERTIDFDYIHHDIAPGVCESARYLISKGRRRPLFLFYDRLNYHDKGKAFLDEFQNHGIILPADALMELPSYEIQNISAFLDAQFSDKPFPYDAVFCSTDKVGMTLMKWLRGRGVKIPDDVAVVGFNDSEFCECFDPPLASVYPNGEKLMEEVERLVFSRLDNPELPPRSIKVPLKFVLRESAG